MKHFVIIGNGIASISAIEAIRQIDQRTPITIISEEPYHTYYRTRLSHLLGENPDADKLLIHKPAWFEENGVTVFLSRKATSIDFQNKSVKLDDGSKLEYSSLLLATGSYPFIPPVPGANLKGVFSIRTLNDVKSLYQYIVNKNTGAVIGGGVLGLEAAWALASKGKKIYVIENAPYILVKQLNKKGSEIIQAMGEKNGISFVVPAQLKKITGNEFVSGIELAEFTSIPVDFVIFSTGVRPNTLLLKDSPVKVNRGIVVDQFMRTNIEGVYAAGDVAEYEGRCYAIWPVAAEQGKVAGANMAGKPIIYNEMIPSNYLKVFGINMFSIGDIFGDDSASFAVEEIDEEKNVYKKIFFKDNVPVGAILIGDIKASSAISAAIKSKKAMSSEFIKKPSFTSFLENIN
ncbi:NAD(P)/FAD-dependent oxidoreductase [Caldanaerobius polysaccharolyticus]|uniref:NAD(P)/FAD-dependent oxidoreductase n=1 Tax=Caldanaerobius polysaccharolyticus TaxID=44256 RepID=UPI00047B710C|nr:FAD-dependent oxidoreductase [Caldanaerobius polysaccharolyticus]